VGGGDVLEQIQFIEKHWSLSNFESHAQAQGQATRRQTGERKRQKEASASPAELLFLALR